ncbi:MAG: epoxyqueuosine reductase [candidate division Zixibacteria bacterium]|nr:epoxyqueuosine reductase [candidate division Zixibacteria bacterium]
MEQRDRKQDLKELAYSLGASAIGICEVGKLVEKFHPEIREKARQLPFALSIGIALQKAVMDTLSERPNDMYKSHYRATNSQLDTISYKLSRRISDFGFQAMPIPASMIVTRYPLLAHVNHREIAHKAGIGWWGKNNLLISPEFGGRIRLTTVLTDLELVPDEILFQDCGKCKACDKACPAGAIGGTAEEFDLEKCQAKVTEFCKTNNFGQLICGLCLNRCPHDGGACG